MMVAYLVRLCAMLFLSYHGLFSTTEMCLLI